MCFYYNVLNITSGFPNEFYEVNLHHENDSTDNHSCQRALWNKVEVRSQNRNGKQNDRTFNESKNITNFNRIHLLMIFFLNYQ